MTRRGRNPRRAYDENGQELKPPTVAADRAAGFRTVQAWCQACGHGAPVPLDRFPDDLPVPDIALKVRCSACGSKRIIVHVNVAELYAMADKQPRMTSVDILKFVKTSQQEP